jgi:hypothetical protein
MQSDRRIADYINEVCGHVKWGKAISEIHEELQDHILCQKDALVAEGMNEASE